jgi:hypothetical protein
VISQTTRTFNCTCKVCGVAFDIQRQCDASGNVAGMCYNGQVYNLPCECKTCKGRSKQARKRAREKNEGWECHACGKRFYDRKRTRCPECIKNNTTKLQCRMCGSEFVGPYGKVYCSRTCYNKSVRRRADAVRERRSRQNAECTGSLFAVSAGRSTGYAAECLFDAWCANRGVVSCRPQMDGCPAIDRVIWKDGRWCGVQIKGTAKEIDKRKINKDRESFVSGVCEYVAVVSTSSLDVAMFTLDGYETWAYDRRLWQCESVDTATPH